MLAKVQGFTRKQLRAFIAILVAVCVVVPSLAAFIVKGASAPTYPDLGLNAGNNYEIASLNSEVNSGTYSLKYNSRTYVFDLDFSPLDKLEKGDTIKFNTASKEVEWTHNIETADRIDIKTVATLNKSKSNDSHKTYQLKENNKIEAGKEYYLETGTNSDGQKTYIVFTPSETVTERTTGTYRGATEVTQKRDLDVVFYLEEEGTHSANSVAINGDEYNIKTIYTETEAKNLTANGIYLIIVNDDGEDYLVQYGLTPDGTVNEAYTTSSTTFFVTTYTDHADPLTVYNPSLRKVVAEYFSDESNVYDSQTSFSQYSLSNNQAYFDSTSDSLSALKFTGTDILPEFQAAASTSRNGYFFLKGFDGSSYSNNKRLGSIYNTVISGNSYYNRDTSNSIYLYNVDTTRRDFRTSNANNNSKSYSFNDGSVWKYTNHDLINDYYDLNPSGKYLVASNGTLARGTNPTTSVTLYEPKIAYSKSEIAVNSNFEKVVAYSDKIPATPISYEETVSSDNGLELNKSVKAISDDLFDVTLEAHMTKANIDRPDTDVEIVLDTSLAMNNKVYESRYENLKTYSEFEGVKTSELTHDMLFDDDNSGGLAGALSDVWQSLSQNRKFQHNKYIEDPNFPGTYVYLHQEYSGSVSINPAHLFYDNKYSYYFTSANGSTYSTKTFDQTAAQAAAGTDKLPSYLEFYLDGTNTNPIKIYTLYHVPGYTATDNKENSLTKNLLTYGGSGKNQLYTKVEGEYKQVKIDNDSNGLYTYYVMDDANTTASTASYRFVTGGRKRLQSEGTPFSGLYSIFQGFRHYIIDEKGQYKLDPNQPSLLSKTLYVKRDTPQTINGLTAMQEAIEEFLLKAHERAVENDAVIHVGLVTYDKGAYVDYALKTIDLRTPVGANTVDTLISHIYNIDLTNSEKGGHNTVAAELGKGMDTAYTEMQASNPGSNRYTLVFAGGMPIAYSQGWLFGYTWDNTNTSSNKVFSQAIADHSVSVANDFKNKMATTVYTVGAYDNADANKINGKAWYYAWRNTWACNGEPGSRAYWGGSWLANLTGYSLDPADAYATNRMLDYMSSNYDDTINTGITRGRYAPGAATGFWDWVGQQLSRTAGYRIDQNHKKIDDGFFFGLSPNTLNEAATGEEAPEPEQLTEEGFKAAMKDIISNLQKVSLVAKTNLDKNAYLVDGITSYFDLENGQDSINAYIATDKGQVVKTLSGEDILYNAKEKTVSVKGFDYSEHFWGDENREAQKLVVKLRIKRDPEFLGGNQIPTNQSKSAVYDGQGEEPGKLDIPGVLVEHFDIPHADLKLIDVDKWVQDDSVFYSESENLADLVNPIWVDGYRNSHVDIQYIITEKGKMGSVNTYTIEHGSTTGSWDKVIGSNELNLDNTYPQLFDTSKYSVEVKITPINEGTVKVKEDEDEAVVYVFKPHFDVDDREVDNYGNRYDLTSIPKLSWEVFDLDGNKISDTKNLKKLLPLDESGKAIEPKVDIGFVNKTDETKVVTSENEETYPIDQETIFQVNPVTVTPTPFYYMSFEDVTHYYDAEGNEIEKEQWDELDSDKRGEQTVKEWVEKLATRDTVDADKDTTFTNLDNAEWTDGRFRIKAKSHDVTVVNHTTGDPGSDYSDPNKEFPLTFTLKDGDKPVANEAVSYIDSENNPQTVTTNSNGQIVISMKDSDTITLKDIRDGYTLTVTSTPSPGDLYELYAKAGKDANTLSKIDVDSETETTAEVEISDDTLIDLTHHIGEIPITGLGNADSKVNPFLIAAIVVAVLGAGWIAYLMKRRSAVEQ